MLIESILYPVRYQWPGGEIKFEPGKPIQVDPVRGKKILEKCQDMVRAIQPGWIEAWRELAELTEGITKNDPRFFLICASLEECDRAFEADDWRGFQRAAQKVKAPL